MSSKHLTPLPDGWAQITFGEVGQLIKGISYSSNQYADSDWGVPFVTIKCVSKLGGFKAEGIKYYKGPIRPHELIETGDLLIANTDLTRAGDIVGCPVRLPDLGAPRVTMSMDLSKVKVDQGVADPGFVYHKLMGRPARSFMREHSSGSTVLHLKTSAVPRLLIQLPANLSEQRKITQILDTLDTAIRETEALIDKLKAVKQGLLRDLLTRGIDANGQLRPPQSEAPQLYKESPLGWIPREWDVVRVGEDTDIDHGFAFPGHQFTDKEVGPALLVPGNFHREGGLYFTPDNTKYFSGKYPQQYVLSHGDVLIVMTDLSPMTLILGRTVVLTETFKVLHNQRIGKFRFKRDGLWDAAFFAEALSQDAVRLKVISEATGTTVRHTSPDRIKSCYVARPKLQEQQLAAQQIATVDARRNFEEANLLKLRQTKSGLMDDLLTGRVRVTPLLESVQQAAAQTGA